MAAAIEAPRSKLRGIKAEFVEERRWVAMPFIPAAPMKRDLCFALTSLQGTLAKANKIITNLLQTADSLNRSVNQCGLIRRRKGYHIELPGKEKIGSVFFETPGMGLANP
jgi:hypothetical protein